MSSDPPVCKLMDYGRHRYEKEKRARDAKKKQATATLKEITSSYKLGEHDYQVRKRRLINFLNKGNKVKMTIRLRGREAQHASLAIELLKRYAEDTVELSTVIKAPQRDGYRVSMILNPKKENK